MKRCITTGAAFLALTLGTLLIGCGGLNQQPIAPAAALREDGGKGHSDSGLSTIVFSAKAPDLSKAQARAAKPVAYRQVSRTFSPRRNGELAVAFGNDDDDDDDRRGGAAVNVKEVVFKVRAGAIDREYNINMGVSVGTTLEDVAVTFSPSGLVFRPPASLKIVLRGRVNASKLLAYHVHGSTVENIPVNISYDDGETVILLQVPGFSTYSLDDSRAPEGDTGW
ncbi:MAG: hypothetical protein A3F84_00790 [Candidatus Handelsmanbacteria bacterium RIFCSPLOWO2_12_FULL_64_10]|uniref:Uncharacterized protein n=1 Tax=Handelsmanbacteria sp. (strain RIFCSPLOWO2_12_FULL_64_10) TaxID=1817868 RepID=A0A1F6CS43_HANXR|nr:MAG: hypothetical protein A3F84_00790 [Candidatus Handelsmanbacteria bacterium RIFCSPLOWO2_12_FULL_64_10]